jgi:hypothetical protein
MGLWKDEVREENAGHITGVVERETGSPANNAGVGDGE